MLQAHFAENPTDLDALRQTPLHVVHSAVHLKHIPTYLMPSGITAEQSDLQLKIEAKRKKTTQQMAAARVRTYLHLFVCCIQRTVCYSSVAIVVSNDRIAET